jgi:hypothetical protein
MGTVTAIKPKFSTKNMMSEANFFKGYSRWNDELGRYETWDDSVTRVMNMHRSKYAPVMTDELEEAISFAEQAYRDKLVLGAQRALQFGGEQIMKHNARMYNCSFSYVDRPVFLCLIRLKVGLTLLVYCCHHILQKVLLSLSMRVRQYCLIIQRFVHVVHIFQVVSKPQAMEVYKLRLINVVFCWIKRLKIQIPLH